MSTQSHIDKVELKPNLMEYPHHVGAPKIMPTDLTPFKQNGTDKANKLFHRQYEELLKQAETLQNSFLITQEVYESSYKLISSKVKNFPINALRYYDFTHTYKIK